MKENNMKEQQKQRRRVSLVGPVILIGLGVVILLNTLGVLAWSVWEVIFRLWPVLLIAAGLEIILNRVSAWGSLVALALTVVLAAVVLGLLGSDIGIGQVVAGEEIRQALNGATQARVVIEPGVGSLHIQALPESANLVEGTIRVGKGQRVRRDFAVAGKTATFTLQAEGATFGPFLGIGRGDERTWDLGLAPEVPIGLEVSLGAGSVDIDLTGLTVSDLKVNTAVGQTKIILPDEGSFRVKTEGAIGETIILIPAGLAVRIRVDTGLGASDMPAGYQQQGNVYTSPGYASADDRVDLEVSQAIGKVTIRQSSTW